MKIETIVLVGRPQNSTPFSVVPGLSCVLILSVSLVVVLPTDAPVNPGSHTFSHPRRMGACFFNSTPPPPRPKTLPGAFVTTMA